MKRWSQLIILNGGGQGKSCLGRTSEGFLERAASTITNPWLKVAVVIAFFGGALGAITS
jgi:hypothetical protein